MPCSTSKTQLSYRVRKLNLSDFEAHISDIILERGWDYYRNDRVKSIEKDSRNTYAAIVAGTEDYKVTVKVGENDATRKTLFIMKKEHGDVTGCIHYGC